jgi:hypothetical protein
MGGCTAPIGMCRLDTGVLVAKDSELLKCGCC